VERATINGAFEPVEKQEKVTRKESAGKGYEEAQIVFRKDAGGGFYAAERRVTQHSESGNQATDNTAEYEIGPTGQLELHGQRYSTTEKRPNGAEDVQIDIFRKNIPGVVNDSRALQIVEHQILERRPVAGGAIVETLSVQRPSVSDPNRLGPPRQISETVCHGKCDDEGHR
jgi:hypothetical protein